MKYAVRRSALTVLALAALAVVVLSTQMPDATAQTPLAQCANHVDDDRNGVIDFPMEPGCTSPDDPTETTPPAPDFPVCSDGVDGDLDELIDFPQDPGCVSAVDTNEQDPSHRAQCSDGLDNDSDGKADYPADRGCIAASDPTEQNTACSDGLDNDSDGKADYADYGCTVPSGAPDQTDNDETDPKAPVPELVAPPGPWPPPVPAANPIAGTAPGTPNGAGASPAVQLKVGFGRRLRSTIAQTVGRTVHIRGTLVNASTRKPIQNAALTIVVQPSGSDAWKPLADPRTNLRGRFQATVPVGGHGYLAAMYWPSSDAPAPTYSRRLLVRAQGRVWLGKPQHTRRSYRFRGKVSGAAIPDGGVLVALQVRNSAGNWLTIRLGRTKADGTVTIRRNMATATRGLRARLKVPRQAGWTLFAGVSKAWRLK